MAFRRSRSRKYLERLIQGGKAKCRYCADKRLSVLTLEHLTPLSRGGTWEPSNLCVTCYRCNLCKDRMTDVEFRHHIKQIGGIEKLPKYERQTANYVRGREKQIRATNGRFRSFDSLAAVQLERATR